MNTRSPPRQLRAVAPTQIEPGRPKVILFGRPGAGKTYGALDFPQPYYIDTEGGAKQDQYRRKLIASHGGYLGPEHGSRDFATVVDEVKALATVEHRYKTLIIDSISEIYNAVISDESARLGDKDAYGASKKPAARLTMQLLKWIHDVDMNVILIAHEKPEWGLDAHGNRAEVGKTFDAFEKVGYALDLALHIRNPGANMRLAQVVKSRFDAFPMGETFPWSFDEFAERYGQDVIAKDAMHITLATADQVHELNLILSERRDGEALKERGLKKASAETLDELTTEQAGVWIETLKQKAA